MNCRYVSPCLELTDALVLTYEYHVDQVVIIAFHTQIGLETFNLGIADVGSVILSA
jgi:hypothetical protein